MAAAASNLINHDFKLAQDFKADWPKELDPKLKSTCSKILTVVWEIFSWIVFPIGLWRLGCSYLKDYLYRIAVIPASNYRNRDGFEDRLNHWEEDLLKTYQGERVEITAPDGATLDTAFFPGKIKGKVILCTCGNGSFWQVQGDRLYMLKSLDVSILLLNPRQVGHSTGKMSGEGLALDVYTAYEYLIHELKFDPDDILLIGHSLGASYGAVGASLIQKKYPDKEIKMISDRSFDNLAVESGAIAKKLGHHIVGNGCTGKMLCSIGSALAPLGVKMLGMQIDQREAFLSLKGKKGVIFSSADQIVPEGASLYRSIEDDLPKDVEVIEMNIYETDDPGQEHNRSFNNREGTEFYRLIEKLLRLETKATFFPNLDVAYQELNQELRGLILSDLIS